MGIKHREQCRPVQSEEERFEHYVLEIEVYGEIQSFFAIFKAVWIIVLGSREADGL